MKNTTKDEEGHILLAGGEVYVDQVIFFFGGGFMGENLGGSLVVVLEARIYSRSNWVTSPTSSIVPTQKGPRAEKGLSHNP